MRRLGQTYEVVGAINPLGHFPSRVYPAYRQTRSSNETQQVFTQVIDSSGKIADFLRIDRHHEKQVIPIFASRQKSWIGQDPFFGFALSTARISFAKGIEQYRNLLYELLDSERQVLLNVFPTAGLEISRYLDDSELELDFAVRAVRRLMSLSTTAAEGG